MLRNLVLVILSLVLAGCVDTAFEVARFTKKETSRMAPRLLWTEYADRGDATAQYEMGKSHCCGKRPLYNNHEALKWFCRAAKQGQRDAMFEIGKIYEHAYETEGSLIPRDDMLAYVYYTLASQYGHDAAAAERERLRKIGVEKRDLAERLVKEWPHIPCRSDLPEMSKPFYVEHRASEQPDPLDAPPPADPNAALKLGEHENSDEFVPDPSIAESIRKSAMEKSDEMAVEEEKIIIKEPPKAEQMMEEESPEDSVEDVSEEKPVKPEDEIIYVD